MVENTRRKLAEGSLYSDLQEDVKHNLAQQGFQPLHCSSKEFVASFLNNVVQRDTLNVDFMMRNVPIQLDGTGQKTQKKKPKRKEVSAKKKRIHGIYNISTANQSCLKSAYPKLLRADYHGCILTVSRSKCPSYIGTSGILLQETKNAFKIITKQHQLKMIPKANSVFNFELEQFVFTVHGNHFRYRSSERSARKFKPKPTTDL
ncbi:ribonuclease P protein subunit p29-like isoform X2 [Acropora millepora]|uniref:ribonuclease P protein subunit p29-like isoform X2 n=1 Tax=Acropora millepora TaxID=45264 RepID=UPI0010FCBE1F|nr:ribonuclease P protein subunit p29-like isoform X2 [Acropora millepora]